MMTRTALAPIALVIGVAAFAASANAQSPAGVWLTKDQDAHVRIAGCGGALCGTIVWLKDPVDKQTGKPPIDEHNPDPAKRSRPLRGIQVMYGMHPSGPGKWTGHLYNADDGKTYDGNLMLLGPDSVKVDGCLIGICMGETWRRVQSTARPAHGGARAHSKS
jgi:uncharacterized protein (DUF2147 family)